MKKDKNINIQFIVNNGIVYNKRDMLMLIRDLGKVSYFEIIGGKVMSKGKGYVMRVCSNSEEPTLFLAGRVYINVGSFNYLKLKKIKDADNTLFELIGEERTIKLVPDTSEKPMLTPEELADSFIELEGMFPPDFEAPTN
ncbi:MAG: hypothetical protein ABH860_00490 [bacterium]